MNQFPVGHIGHDGPAQFQDLLRAKVLVEVVEQGLVDVLVVEDQPLGVGQRRFLARAEVRVAPAVDPAGGGFVQGLSPCQGDAGGLSEFAVVELRHPQPHDLFQAAVDGAVGDDGPVPSIPALEDFGGVGEEADEVRAAAGEAALGQVVVGEVGESGTWGGIFGHVCTPWRRMARRLRIAERLPGPSSLLGSESARWALRDSRPQAGYRPPSVAELPYYAGCPARTTEREEPSCPKLILLSCMSRPAPLSR